MEPILPGDGKLHISEEDFSRFVEQVAAVPLRYTDGCGLKVYVRFDPEHAKAKAFDLLADLTSHAGKGEPHYDLLIGGVE